MPRYGGRQKGSVNRLAKEAIDQAKKGGPLPHEWLLSIVRGEPVKQKVWDIERDPQTGRELSRQLKEDIVYPSLDTRVDAAKAAAPYYAPKLATQHVELTGEDGGPVEIDVKDMPDDQKAKLVADLLERVSQRATEDTDED